MTNREYIQSLPDEEFAKYINRHDLRESGDWMNKPCICDYKHEFQKRCSAMKCDCCACMLDFLQAERIEEKEEKKQMKPEIGDKVFVMYENSLIEETVLAVGKDFFFTSAYGEEYIFDSWKYYFKDYGKTWAFTFKKMKEMFPLGVKKIKQGYWEAKK